MFEENTFFTTHNYEPSRLEILQRLNPKVFTSIDFNEFSSEGKLDCLQFIFSVTGKVLGEDACYNAAANGHLSCLKFLIDKGAEYDFDEVWNVAYSEKHHNCLRFLENIKQQT